MKIHISLIGSVCPLTKAIKAVPKDLAGFTPVPVMLNPKKREDGPDVGGNIQKRGNLWKDR